MRIRCLIPMLAILPWQAPLAGALDLRAAVASDEIFRGIPQNNSLTVSLAAAWRCDNRVYIGGRLLNNRSQGQGQADTYAGYSQPVNLFGLLQATADAGVSASVFGGDRAAARLADPDYLEAYGSFTVGPLRLGLALSPDYFGTGGAAYRLSSQLKSPLPLPGLSATAVLGWNGGQGVERLVASRNDDGRGEAYGDYSLSLVQDLPRAISIYAQAAGTSTKIDGSRAPVFLLGLRWRYGV